MYLTTKQRQEQDLITNASGGPAHTISDSKRLERFLILGVDGGTYYASAEEMGQATKVFIAGFLAKDPLKFVTTLISVAVTYRALKHDNALYCLALALRKSKDAPEIRRPIAENFKRMVRTFSHVFTLVEIMEREKVGWGRYKKQLFKDWLDDLSPNELMYQISKYKNREGWSVQDFFRMVHPVPSGDRVAIYDWATNKKSGVYPAYLSAIDFLLKPEMNVDDLVKLVERYELVREQIPTQFLNDMRVWEAMLPKMPIEALVKNLGTMASKGGLTLGSKTEGLVLAALTDSVRIRKSHVHPWKLFLAWNQYRKGEGNRSDKKWAVNQTVVNAIEAAIELSYANVNPTGINTMYALDVSGSMTNSYIGDSGISAYEAEAFLTSILLRCEPNSVVVRFDTAVNMLNVNHKSSLSSIKKAMEGWKNGATNCGAAFDFARVHGLPIEMFVVITDSESNTGRDPYVALREYRRASGKTNAKLAVLAMTATRYSIGREDDMNVMNFVGMDANVPQALNEFARL